MGSFLTVFGAAAPAGADTTGSFFLSSASLPAGQSSVTWQDSPNTLPDPVTLSGNIDTTTGAISGATLVMPSWTEQQQGQTVTFALSEVNPATATGTYNATSGAVTLNDTLQLTFSVLAFSCVSTPWNIALSGTYDATTQDLNLATTSSFTIPSFPVTASCISAVADGLNANPGGVTGSTGNGLAIAVVGKLAPLPPTQTLLGVSPSSPTVPTTNITLTATVTDPSGAGVPTGSVNFFNNGVLLNASPVALAPGAGTATATCSSACGTTTLPQGNLSFTAVYLGSTTYAGSSSAPISYVIDTLPTITSTGVPTQLMLGADPSQFDLTLTNPAAGLTDLTNLQLWMATNVLTSEAADLTLSYQDANGNWCPITPTGFQSIYKFTGFGTPSGTTCGSMPSTFELDPGGSLTVPLEMSASTSLPLSFSQLQIQTTLYTVNSSGNAEAPLSGSVAPTTQQVHTVTAAMNPTSDVVPQGFSFDLHGSSVKAPSTPPGLPFQVTGNVTALVDGNPVPVSLSGASQAACNTGSLLSCVISTAGLSQGTHTLTLVYQGSPYYAAAISAPLTFTVTAPPGGTLYACEVIPPIGQPFPFVAYVTVQDTSTLPPGAALNGTTVDLPAVNVTINADAVAADIENNVQSPSPAIGLSPGGTATGGVISKWAVANDVGTATFTGWSAIGSNGVPISGQLGSILPLGVGTISWGGFSNQTCSPASPLQPTEQSTFGSTMVAGTALSVNPTGSVAPSTPVTITATLYGSYRGSVQFLDGSTVLAQYSNLNSSSGVVSVATAALPPGEHQLTAVWSGGPVVIFTSQYPELTANATIGSIPQNTSNEVDLFVGDQSTTTLSASPPSPGSANQPVTFTATVSPPDGVTTQPTGDVSFSEDGNAVSSCQDQPLSMDNPPTATCTLTFGGGESHQIVATYSGDGNFAGSASDPLTYDTNAGLPATTSTLTTKANPASAGPVTFWDGVKASSGGPVPTGTVAFTVDGKAYAPCAAQPLGPGGGASCTLSFRAGTTHKVYATYPGSASYSGSVSNTITLQVNSTGSSTVPKATGGSATLPAGKSLSPGQRLTAGSYRLVMQPDGNLVKYQGTKALWASHTAGHPGTGVVMQRDGNLVEYDHGHAIWASNTAGHPGAHLTLQGSDGNVVIYQGSTALWATGT